MASNIIRSISGLELDKLNKSDISALLESIDSLKPCLIKALSQTLSHALPTTIQLVKQLTSPPVDNFLGELMYSYVIKDLKKITFKAHPRKKNSPKTAVFGVPYPYNGDTGVIALPLSDMECLPDLLKLVNFNYGTNFNSILINKYITKNVVLGFHQDNEASIVPNSCILTLSIGALRELAMSKLSSGGDSVDVKLENNSAFLMKAGCQSQLWHSVLKGTASGIRYSLTFRELIVDEASEKACDVGDHVVGVVNAATVDVTEGKSLVDSVNPVKKSDILNDDFSIARNILIIGDSLVGGLNERLIEAGQKDRQDSETDYVTKTCCKVSLPGAHVNRVHEYLSKLKAPEKVSDLVLLVGGNDVENSHSHERNGKRFVHIDEIVKNFHAISNLIKDRFPFAKVYVFSIIPRLYRDKGHQAREALINDCIKGICSRNQFRLLDRAPNFRSRTDNSLIPKLYNNEKMIHLTPKGNGVLGKVVVGAIFYPRVFTI